MPYWFRKKLHSLGKKSALFAYALLLHATMIQFNFLFLMHFLRNLWTNKNWHYTLHTISVVGS